MDESKSPVEAGDIGPGGQSFSEGNETPRMLRIPKWEKEDGSVFEIPILALTSRSSLGTRIGNGQEGSVYNMTDNPSAVLKIYCERKYFLKELRAYGRIQKLNLPSLPLAQYCGVYSIPKDLVAGEEHRLSQWGWRYDYKLALSIEKINARSLADLGMEDELNCDFSDSEIDKLEEILYAALDKFHKAGFCHGDVQSVNMLVPDCMENVCFVDLCNSSFKDDVSEEEWETECHYERAGVEAAIREFKEDLGKLRKARSERQL